MLYTLIFILKLNGGALIFWTKDMPDKTVCSVYEQGQISSGSPYSTAVWHGCVKK